MKRRSTLKLLAGAAAVTSLDTVLPRFAGAQAPRPNFVVVVIDDLRWDELGFSGHPYLETPNIDRLSRESANFTRAFHTTPLCSPNRACILTGEYVTKHHAAIIATAPPKNPICNEDMQATVDAQYGPIPELVENYEGPCVIETFTATFTKKGEPDRGVILAAAGNDDTAAQAFIAAIAAHRTFARETDPPRV